MKAEFSDLANTFGLLLLWLAELVYCRQPESLDTFLSTQGYVYMGCGIWEKRGG